MTKAEIWLFQAAEFQAQLTEGGPGEGELEGTLYLIGSDGEAS